MTPNQRAIVASDGFWPCGYDSATADNYTAISADMYFDMASDPSVIAVIPFIWFNGGGATLGIRDLTNSVYPPPEAAGESDDVHCGG